MKASNAVSASALVSAIQISCNDRFAFGCWLFGSLFRTLAVLCTQQRCSTHVCHTSPSAFQNPSAPSATAILGAIARPRFFKSTSNSRQSCALSRAPSVKPINLLLAFRSGADQHKDALLVVLQPGLQMDAIRPDVDVSPGRQIALLPAIMFVAPGLR